MTKTETRNRRVKQPIHIKEIQFIVKAVLQRKSGYTPEFTSEF